MKSQNAKTLKKYIRKNYSSQREFADAQGVKPQQVTQWLQKDFIVIGDKMYSFRRALTK